MKNRWKVLGLVVAALFLIGLLAMPTGQSEAAVGFRISGRNLVDANGNVCVLRGISHAHTWYPTQTSSFANIKAAGANAIRVVLSGGRWTKNTPTDVANVINLCKTNKLVCVLENHDTTGYGEDGAAYSMSQAVTYWRDLQSVLTGQEAYVIINIGNEPYGNNNAGNWGTDTRNAIAAMRSAGFDHTLMVDAPNWGQDWQFYMRDNAATISNSDPDRNTILSIHMYGVFDTAAEIQNYLAAFASSGLPLVIGEFGHNHSDGNPDEDTIMAQAQAQNVGYFGWSWSGNSGGVEYLDMVTSFNPGQLTSWGDRIINGANGLKQTSRECSIYGGQNPTTPPPTTPAVTTPPPTTPPPTTPAGQAPYGGTPAAIPGTIQAENYDTGGEGVAYHDTTAGNSGNAYRTTERVDVETTTDSGGGYNVGWTAAGEWLEYTVNVTAGGTYTLNARVASQSGGGTMHVEVDGVNVTGAMAIPSTGGWQTWTIVTRTGLSLSAGQHVLRIAEDSAGFNLNWVSLTGGGTPPVTTPPPTTPPATTPPATTPPPTTPPATTPPATTPPPTSGPGACSPVTSTITVPFTFDGAGTFCWQTSRLGSYINSWNLDSLTINGVDFTNRWANAYPPAVNGSWYISYRGSFPWSHFEAR